MRYEFFIGLRYALVSQGDRFVSFVSLLSALGIALGVAALIVVLAVMTGFQSELRERILAVASHMEVVGRGDGIDDWESVAADYLAAPEVVAAAPNIQGQGLLSVGDLVQGALVRGVLPDAEKSVSEISEHLVSGDWSALQDGEYGMILGEQLARKLRVKNGDKLILIAPKGRSTIAGLLPRLRQFHVKGVFSSNVHQYDSALVYIHLNDAQRVFRLGDKVTSLRLKLSDLFDAPRLQKELGGIREDVFLYDWTTSSGSLFRALALEKRAMFIVLTLIVAVAAFNIVSALVTMVRNKRGDIAILRAMGATGGAITRAFLLQGMLIGGMGVLAGLGAGIALAVNVGKIVGWLEKKFEFDIFPGDVYQLGELPSRVVASDIAIVAVTAFLLSLAATVYPAWRAGRLLPAESLRHE